MRRHIIRTLLIGTATAAAVGLGAGQAFAAATITITGAGGPISGTSSNAMFADTTSGQSFRCTSVGFRGSLANVTNAPLPYTATGFMTSWSFSGCNSAFGTAAVTVPASALPDNLEFRAVGPSAPQASGVVQTPSGVLFHFAVQTCGFDAVGQINFTWTNGMSGQLRLFGNSLHPSNVSVGCIGLVSATDILTVNATFNVTPTTIVIEPGQ